MTQLTSAQLAMLRRITRELLTVERKLRALGLM